MAWLPDGENFLKIRLFVVTQSMNVTEDTQTYTTWRHMHSIAQQVVVWVVAAKLVVCVEEILKYCSDFVLFFVYSKRRRSCWCAAGEVVFPQFINNIKSVASQLHHNVAVRCTQTCQFNIRTFLRLRRSRSVSHRHRDTRRCRDNRAVAGCRGTVQVWNCVSVGDRRLVLRQEERCTGHRVGVTRQFWLPTRLGNRRRSWVTSYVTLWCCNLYLLDVTLIVMVSPG